MNRFQINNVYNYGEIDEIILHDENIDMFEWGMKDMIGEEFIVLKDKSHNVVSFVLHSANSLGYNYKCIYSNFN